MVQMNRIKETLTFKDEYGKPLQYDYDVWFKEGKFHSVVNSLGFSCEPNSQVWEYFECKYNN